MLVLGLAAAAQPPPIQPPPIDDARVAAARLMVQESIGPNFFRHFYPAFQRGFLQTTRLPPGMTRAEAERIVHDVVLPIVRRREAAMTEAIVVIYAREFSVEQLEELRRFFSSPTGRRLMDRETEINGAITAAARAMSQTMMAEDGDEVRAAMRGRGIEL